MRYIVDAIYIYIHSENLSCVVFWISIELWNFMDALISLSHSFLFLSLHFSFSFYFSLSLSLFLSFSFSNIFLLSDNPRKLLILFLIFFSFYVLFYRLDLVIRYTWIVDPEEFLQRFASYLILISMYIFLNVYAYLRLLEEKYWSCGV